MTIDQSSSFSRRELVGFVAGGAVLAGVASSILSRIGHAGGGRPLQPLTPQRGDRLALADGFESYAVLNWDDPIAKGLRFGFNNDFVSWVRPQGRRSDEVILFVNHEDLHEGMVSGYDGTGEKA